MMLNAKFRRRPESVTVTVLQLQLVAPSIDDGDLQLLPGDVIVHEADGGQVGMKLDDFEDLYSPVGKRGEELLAHARRLQGR
jgi:hypothetical protein